MYLLCLEVTEGQSWDLCLSVAERTSAWDGLATEYMLGRLPFEPTLIELVPLLLSQSSNLLPTGPILPLIREMV